MNINTPLAIIALTSVSFGPILAQSPATHGDPYTPVGRLHVSRKMVRTGTKPLLSWEIQYPRATPDIIIPKTGGGITPKVPVLMQIRVAGKNNNGHGNNEDGVDSSNLGQGKGGPNGGVDESDGFDDEKKASRLLVRNGAAAWTDLLNEDFTTQDGNTLYSEVIKPGDLIDFAVEVTTASGESGVVQWTQTNNFLVTGLINGDQFPMPNPSTEISPLLSPYVNDEGAVVLGPREMLCAFELDTTDPASEDYDLQDLVVIITFDDVPTR